MDWVVSALLIISWFLTVYVLLNLVRQKDREFARERLSWEAERRTLETERRDLLNRTMYMAKRPWEGPPLDAADQEEPEDPYIDYLSSTEIVGVTD